MASVVWAGLTLNRNATGDAVDQMRGTTHTVELPVPVTVCLVICCAILPLLTQGLQCSPTPVLWYLFSHSWNMDAWFIYPRQQLSWPEHNSISVGQSETFHNIEGTGQISCFCQNHAAENAALSIFSRQKHKKKTHKTNEVTHPSDIHSPDPVMWLEKWNKKCRQKGQQDNVATSNIWRYYIWYFGKWHLVERWASCMPGPLSFWQILIFILAFGFKNDTFCDSSFGISRIHLLITSGKFVMDPRTYQ